MNLAYLQDKGMSFTEYFALFEKLAQKQKTTGLEKSEDRVEATRLNLVRTKRLLKHTNVPFQLKATPLDNEDKQHWFILTETWCKDAANILPLMAKIAEENPGIEPRVFLRDEYPRLMDRFLSDGKRSIPKLICCNQYYDVIWTWGSRPESLERFISKYKKEHPFLNSMELQKQIQLWYLNDKGQSFFDEVGVNIVKELKADLDQQI